MVRQPSRNGGVTNSIKNRRFCKNTPGFVNEECQSNTYYVDSRLTQPSRTFLCCIVSVLYSLVFQCQRSWDVWVGPIYFKYLILTVHPRMIIRHHCLLPLMMYRYLHWIIDINFQEEYMQGQPRNNWYLFSSRISARTTPLNNWYPATPVLTTTTPLMTIRCKYWQRSSPLCVFY